MNLDELQEVTKRYWLFAGDHYYPGGGFCDFVGAYEHLDEAIDTASLIKRDYGYNRPKYDWAHIFDEIERDIVWRKNG